MSSNENEQRPADIQKLHADFLRRGWLEAGTDSRPKNNAGDLVEGATMMRNALSVVAHTFGKTDQEKKDIFFNSKLGQFMNAFGDDILNLAEPVKPSLLKPAGPSLPRNTSHPAKAALTLLVLNACAMLMPYHKKKARCFREVSNLLKKHDAHLKPETIAKIWYRRVGKIHLAGHPIELRLYADIFIFFGEPASRGSDHADMTDQVSRYISSNLPAIPADLRNAK